MRERFFKGMLGFLESHPSKIIARAEIQILFRATAKAFEKRGCCVLFSKDPLKEYALFTAACMETPADRGRLYAVSLTLGRKIRKVTGFTDASLLKRLVFLLYRNIGITMTGQLPGMVTVTACYFAGVYSKEQCSFISAMDAGIIAGICGDGTLAFSKRITEGCKQCTACFRKE